jgi:MFS family permease
MPARRLESPHWLLTTAIVVSIPVAFDGLGLSVALPSIGKGLSATTSELSWIMSLTLIMMAGGAVAAGRLIDSIGRRPVLLGGLAVTTVATVGCALSPSVGVLILFRALQGIGFSAVFTGSVVLASHAYPGERRSVGISRWFAAAFLASIVGSPLIGSICQFLSWQWVFWIDLPILGVGTVLVLLTDVHPSSRVASPRLDSRGLGLQITGFLLISAGLQSANELGWFSPLVVGAFAAGVAALLAFVWSQLHRPSPLIDLDLFRSKRYLLATLVTFVASIIVGALIFLTPLYLQVGLGITPTVAGLILIAFEGPAFLFSLDVDVISRRFGPNILMMIGMGFFTLGCVAIARVQWTSGLPLVVLALVLTGCGRGNALPGSSIAALGTVNEHLSGAATGILTQVRFFGQAVGVAVGVVTFNTFAERRLNDIIAGPNLTHAQVHDLHGLLSGSPAADRAILHDAPELAGTLHQVVRSASAAGFEAVGVLLVLTGAIGLVVASYDRRCHDPRMATDKSDQTRTQQDTPTLVGSNARARMPTFSRQRSGTRPLFRGRSGQVSA